GAIAATLFVGLLLCEHPEDSRTATSRTLAVLDLKQIALTTVDDSESHRRKKELDRLLVEQVTRLKDSNEKDKRIKAGLDFSFDRDEEKRRGPFMEDGRTRKQMFTLPSGERNAPESFAECCNKLSEDWGKLPAKER